MKNHCQTLGLVERCGGRPRACPVAGDHEGRPYITLVKPHDDRGNRGKNVGEGFKPSPTTVINNRRYDLSFQSYGHALAAANAQRAQPALEIAAHHLVRQRDHQARAGAADGMSQRDA